MATHQRERQRRVPGGVLGIGVNSFLEQHFRDFTVAAMRGKQQRRASGIITGASIGTIGQQYPHDVRRTGIRRNVDGGLVIDIPSVHIRLVKQKQLHSGRRARGRGQMQRGDPVFILRVDFGVCSQQPLDHTTSRGK